MVKGEMCRREVWRIRSYDHTIIFHGDRGHCKMEGEAGLGQVGKLGFQLVDDLYQAFKT